jgi:TolA-binding protein
VRVAPRGGTEVMLAPGGTWAPVITATAPPPTPQTAAPPTFPQTAPSIAARVPATPRVTAIAQTTARINATTPITATPPRITAPAPTPAQPSVAERSYEAAWQALRTADYTAAAAGFARTIELGSPLSEDAAFWRGVALARGFRLHAGSSVPARDAFATFLDRYPRSPRAGEASAMLGWLLVDAGDPAAAAPRFTAAKDDPVDSVRASARRGLAAIPHK